MTEKDERKDPLHRMHEGVEHIDHVTFGKNTDDEPRKEKLYRGTHLHNSKFG